MTMVEYNIYEDLFFHSYQFCFYLYFRIGNTCYSFRMCIWNPVYHSLSCSDLHVQVSIINNLLT